MSDEERPETTAARRTTTGVRGWAVRAVAVVCLVALALALVFQWAPHVNLGLAALVLLAATLVLTVGPKQAGVPGPQRQPGRADGRVRRVRTRGRERRGGRAADRRRRAGQRGRPGAGHVRRRRAAAGAGAARARTLSRLQTLSDQELRHQDGAAVEAFLANAARVVGRLRATVFRNLVARELRDGGWVRRRGAGRLPTLGSLWVREDESILVRPLFATGAAGRAAATRWRDELGGWPGAADRRIVVVPDRFRMPAPEPSEAEVRTLADLRALAVPASAPRQRRTR